MGHPCTGKRSFKNCAGTARMKFSFNCLIYLFFLPPLSKCYGPSLYILQIKGRWESNINFWFPFMYSQKGNCYFQNRIIMFCLPVPTLVYLREIFIFLEPTCLFCSTEILYVDRSREYINCSQTHECGNWDWGRAIPRKGIHKWDFPCIVGSSMPEPITTFSSRIKCSISFQWHPSPPRGTYWEPPEPQPSKLLSNYCQLFLRVLSCMSNIGWPMRRQAWQST